MYSTTGAKVPLRTVVKANSELISKLPENLSAVIVGGTSGIGEATSYKFATYIKKPKLYLLGRNEESAKRVIENLNKINNDKDASYEFIKTDVSLLHSDDDAVRKIVEKETKLNAIILSAGFMGTGVRNETKEGLDMKMSTHYYGRWRLISELVPLLDKAASLSEPACVISVLGPDASTVNHPEDLELKQNYSSSNCRSHTCTMTSYAAERFARLYPKISFVHQSPGLVNTNIGKDMPWYLRYPARGLMKVVGADPSDIAERMFYVSILNPNFMEKGHSWLLDNSLRSIKLSPPLNDQEGKKFWDHTEQVFQRIVN